jgi:hypothetical protein
MKLAPIEKNQIINTGPFINLYKRLVGTVWLQALVVWILIIGFGLVMLLARYYHAPGVIHSKIGFFCSAYYFVIITPVLYYLVLELSGRKWLAITSTALWWVIST